MTGDRAALKHAFAEVMLNALQANPADPKIAGSLVVPGFSDYLHPMANGLLLGFGKGAQPDRLKPATSMVTTGSRQDRRRAVASTISRMDDHPKSSRTLRRAPMLRRPRILRQELQSSSRPWV